MKPLIQMSSPDIDESDVAAVIDVVRSGQLSMGSRIERFETMLAEYVGVRHCVAVSSGTAALHLAALGLGLVPGDEVLVPAFTFSATINAALFVGARPVFVDVTPDTFNIDPDDIRRKITPRTRAIVVVDVFGHPADWSSIQKIAEEHELLVIDDSCEALGASCCGRRIGSFGHAATFGFYPNKQLTTGEGGALVTDDDRLADVARSLRNQGRGTMGVWLTHERLGYNYRLDEMSAALGCSQLGRIGEILARRAAVAQMYVERLSGIDQVRLPVRRDDVEVSWFVFVVLLDRELDRDRVAAELEQRGIPTRVYFSPVHEQPYVREMGFAQGVELPVTSDIGRRTLALPFHGGLTEEQVELVARSMSTALERTSGLRPQGA